MPISSAAALSYLFRLTLTAVFPVRQSYAAPVSAEMPCHAMRGLEDGDVAVGDRSPGPRCAR